MVDTQKKLADLQTLWADNSTRQISAQDIRDALVTLMGGYGSIHCNDGSGTQNVATATKVVVNQFTANGAASGVTPDHTNDKLTTGIVGDYLMLLTMSFASDAAAGEAFEARILVAGAEVNGLSAQKTVTNADDVNEIVVSGIADDVAAAAAITVQIEHDGAGTQTFDVKQANLSMKLVG
jgi:hypothetical protein